MNAPTLETGISRDSVKAVLHCGDAVAVLRGLAEESVNCCITSPPYFALRNYGVSGQIGQEETPDEYVERLVNVFREVRRVLRNDGTLWINIGDTYASKRPYGKIKRKDLIGIPWLLAFALRNDGWYLRQEIIWHKPNPIPESVKDRVTRAHEQIFLLSKSARYYFKADAIKEPAKGAGQKRSMGPKSLGNTDRNDGGRTMVIGEKRNKRSVWLIAPRPDPSAHFASFPVLIPEICLKAGCPEGGTVLDPFSGAATTGAAALQNKRRYAGIELNSEYVKIGTLRIVDGKHSVLIYADRKEDLPRRLNASEPGTTRRRTSP
ncbi:MAG: site-specific DNA-methyltransferase [Bryobacteraceae bacterium]